MNKYIFFFTLFLFVPSLHAQEDSLQISGDKLLYYKAGDSIPVLNLDSIVILPKMRFNNYKELRRYRWVRRKIYKVYPFAKMAGDNLVELEMRLNKMKTKRQRKRYIKVIQRWIKSELEPELKNLTQSEGRFLSKLVYRQTGQTVYDILKKYKSGWTAWWYQRMAKLYHIDLKVKFDPENIKEDYWIEDILQRAFRDEILEPQPNKLGYRFMDLQNKWKPPVDTSKTKPSRSSIKEKVLHLQQNKKNKQK